MDYRRLLLLPILLLPFLTISTKAQSTFVYLSPRPGAILVSTGTTVAFRSGARYTQADLESVTFKAIGTRSGPHTGRTILADDHETVIFQPDLAFFPDEEVHVTIDAVRPVAVSTSYSFPVASTAPMEAPSLYGDLVPSPAPPEAPAAETLAPARQYLTAPEDFPAITVTTALGQTGEGYIFTSNFSLRGAAANKAYLLILDNAGEPVYYKRLTPPTNALDFKRQPNGMLTYFDSSVGAFVAMDDTYTIVNGYHAGNGYTTDSHDLVVLPNGHALLMIYDRRTVDLSAYGGKPDATVIGLVIQELDTLKRVVFEWRSWDHIPITDSTVPITGDVVDYVHGNSIEQDTDGNILISSRHIDEVTKINRKTGAIIWRLGGKKNQFRFINDAGFFRRHDARRLPNGNITLFDNRSDLTPLYSRAVEYKLDEVAKTATRVWQYRNTPDTYGRFTGSTQRLPNGNTVIGWGGTDGTMAGLSRPMVTEVDAEGRKVLEMMFAPWEISYRTKRFPWEGHPLTNPTLVTIGEHGNRTLAFSWNGATDVAEYRIYAGHQPESLSVIKTVARSGFETRVTLTNQQGSFCYYRVLAINKDGAPTNFSNLVPGDLDLCQPSVTYLPLVVH